MSIDWPAFTPYSATVGGLLIGLATAIFFLGTGRIAGISGIVGGLLSPKRGDISWRLLFVGGLLSAPWVWRLFAPLPAMEIDSSWPILCCTGRATKHRHSARLHGPSATRLFFFERC